MIVKLIIVLCLLLLAWNRWCMRKLLKLANEFKSGFLSVPFLGHSYLFIGNNEHQMQVIQRFGRESIKQGGISKCWQANKLYLVLSDPGLADFILKNCLEKDEVMNLTHFAIGNGSIFAPVSIWRRRRKILAPTFSQKNLLQFMNVFSEQSQIFVDLLHDRVNEGDFSIWTHVTTYAMDSIAENTIGLKLGSQRNPKHEILHCLDQVCSLMASRLCQPWLHSDFVYKKTSYYKEVLQCKKICVDLLDKVIADKRKSMREEKETNLRAETRENGLGLKTFLDLLIESSSGDKSFTDLELQEESIVIAAAGTDTSAVGISFMTVMLSMHQDIQEKVYQEIHDVFGDSDRPIQAEDLLKLGYLDAVIKETLRLYPPAPIIVRRIDKNITLPTGVTLVEGCGIVVHIWALHRNPKYWGDDADLFRPERFIDTPLKHPNAFMPFSNGSRGCIGSQYAMMSMKTILANLLRRYRVLPCAENSDAKSGDRPLRVKFNIMMRHVDNYVVRLELRK